MTSRKAGGLEIGEDLEFERRSWVVQRVGWALMAVVILAALGGVFGAGPLSSTRAASSSGLVWIEYERFGRFKSPYTLRVHFDPQAIGKGSIRFWIDRAYLDEMRPERILPEPHKVEIAAQRLLYEFPAAAGAGPGVITFELKPNTFGRIEGRLGLDGGDELRFGHLVYP